MSELYQLKKDGPWLTADEGIEQNVRLIYFIIGRYDFDTQQIRREVIDRNEIEQRCYLALWNAVTVFDVSKGFKFSTYACAAIIRAIGKSIEKQVFDAVRCGGTYQGVRPTDAESRTATYLWWNFPYCPDHKSQDPIDILIEKEDRVERERDLPDAIDHMRESRGKAVVIARHGLGCRPQRELEAVGRKYLPNSNRPGSRASASYVSGLVELRKMLEGGE